MNGSNVVNLRQVFDARTHLESLRAAPEKQDDLRDTERDIAQARLVLVRLVLRLITEGLKEADACRAVVRSLEQREHTEEVLRQARLAIVGGGDAPSWQTLQRWRGKYAAGGLVALAPLMRGQPLQWRAWHAVLMLLLQQPPVRYATTYCLMLNARGFADVTPGKVLTFLKSLPAELYTHSKKLHGAHNIQQNYTPHKRIREGSIPPGFCWTVDGHTLDWYTRHHNSGNKYRYELILIKDRGSKYFCGWWLCDDEAAYATVYALRHAILRTQHIPVELHVDCGPGYTNRLIADGLSGFCARLGIHLTVALPGNARAKGSIESEFRWLEQRLAPVVGNAYCGKDMPQEYMRRLDRRIALGEVTLPEREQSLEYCGKYLEGMNHKKSGRAPSRAEVWDTRKRCEPGEVALPLPTEKRTVSKNAELRIHNRHYRHADLMAWREREVLVETDIHDVTSVRVLELDGKWICTSARYDGDDWKPASLMEELEQKRLAQQIKRLEHHVEEKRAQARTPISIAPAGFVQAVAGADELVPERIESLRREEIENAAVVEETADERFARALQLESSAQLGAADTTWLEIYQTSAEYHSRRALHEEFANNTEESQK